MTTPTVWINLTGVEARALLAAVRDCLDVADTAVAAFDTEAQLRAAYRARAKVHDAIYFREPGP